MENDIIQFVGGPCGQHGPYTFYKAFKYKKNGIQRIVTLSEFFFVKLWMDSDLLCIGELQLLWMDKNSEQVLASLRLYFLPENTPEGRTDQGEDEVLAIAEKVVLRVEDLVTWITVDAEWTWGRLGKCDSEVKEPPDQKEQISPISLSESSLDFSDVEKEKHSRAIGKEEIDGPSVLILSYPRYCRYRAIMRRLENVENDYLKHNIVKALGGLTVSLKNTRVMFCRETFEYPELEGHEMLCNHLAPKLKGRPRGKRKKRSLSPGSESNESESSVSMSFTSNKSKTSKNGINCDNPISPRRSTRSTDNSESKEFVKKLTVFMKSNRTPLGRIPCLGYKEIDLFEFHTKVEKLGGYDAITTNRLWKSIFDDISGHQNSTGAATIIRRHYERFLLPYARHLRGEEHKPLPVSERRRLKSKTGSSHSESETSESTSGNTTPVPPVSITLSVTENKETSNKQEGKTSSLRSVRVKPERKTKEIKIEEPEIKQEEPVKEEIKYEHKNTEPLTSAVALVAQKTSPPRTPSPVECEIKTEEITKCESSVPSDTETSLPENSKTQTEITEIKKEKLEILKEGGLEVTPVKIPSVPIDNRPIKVNDIPQSLNISKVSTPIMRTPKKHTSYVNKDVTPPKVVQSKSIYSYSEKIVYGNPKDCLMGHTPINYRKPGGDLLDLTLTSPQKPEMKYESNVIASLPEGRKLGSNLEITLVGPSKFPNGKNYQIPRPMKRTMENYSNPSKYPRIEENGHRTYRESINIPRPFAQPVAPSYENKPIPPYFPILDPLLYSAAMQSLVSNPISPPFLPYASPEQLKFYTELLAQNRLAFPFQLGESPTKKL